MKHLHLFTKGGRLNQLLRPQFVLLVLTVVLAWASHVIYVPELEPLNRRTAAAHPAPAAAPSGVRQKAAEKLHGTEAAAHAATIETFDPFAGIVQGISEGKQEMIDSNYETFGSSPQVSVHNLFLSFPAKPYPQKMVKGDVSGGQRLSYTLPILIMPGAEIGKNGVIISSSSEKTQAINALIRPDNSAATEEETEGSDAAHD